MMATLVIVAVVGICGLATMVSSQTDKLVAATSSRGTDAPTAMATQSTAAMGSPAATLSTLQDPDAKSSTSSKQTQVPACNSALQAAASAHQRSQLRSESVRHSNAVLSLKTTGMVTKFLNPYMYNSRLSRENSNHRNIIGQIERRYQAAITSAHC